MAEKPIFIENWPHLPGRLLRHARACISTAPLLDNSPPRSTRRVGRSVRVAPVRCEQPDDSRFANLQPPTSLHIANRHCQAAE